ncbi:MAG: 50S ribosomal protein L4 [Patescibacteria group bacterium]
MTKVKVYNLEGEEKEQLELSDSVFAVPMNEDLVHQVYVAIASNKRQVLAHTKTRGERAGSGKKPWRQKGTGRARVGSVRTPVWKKGGVVFGPRKDRNFSQKINQKMKAQAIRMVLAEKLKGGNLFVLDNLEAKEKKTKEYGKVVAGLGLKGSVLWSFESKEKDLRRYTRNLEKVSNILTGQLNVFDMLNTKNLVMSSESAKMLSEKYKKD